MRLLKNIIVFLLLIFIQTAAMADGRGNLTLDEMASRLQKQNGVHILSADVQQGKQGVIYRFKVKKDGRVRVLLMHPDGTPVKRQ